VHAPLASLRSDEKPFLLDPYSSSLHIACHLDQQALLATRPVAPQDAPELPHVPPASRDYAQGTNAEAKAADLLMLSLWRSVMGNQAHEYLRAAASGLEQAVAIVRTGSIAVSRAYHHQIFAQRLKPTFL